MGVDQSDRVSVRVASKEGSETTQPRLQYTRAL
jgi:hypothetical protein